MVRKKMFYIIAMLIVLVDNMKLKKRMLSGFCQELFYFPDSTKEEFWNNDFSDGLNALNDVRTGISSEDLLSSKPSKSGSF